MRWCSATHSSSRPCRVAILANEGCRSAQASSSSPTSSSRAVIVVMVVSCLLAPVLSKPVVPISEETLTLGRCSEDLQRQVRKVAVSPCSLPLLWQCSSGVRIVEAQETRFFSNARITNSGSIWLSLSLSPQVEETDPKGHFGQPNCENSPN